MAHKCPTCGQKLPGPRGKPRVMDPLVRQRILDLYAGGLGARRIARILNADGVPTSRGGVRWWPSTCEAVRKGGA